MLTQKLNSVMLVDEALASTTLHDRISVPSLRTLTDAGQMIVPCKFARIGSQKYLAGQVFTTDALLKKEGLKATDIIVLHRDEATVFDADSMDSFRSSPVTLGHPKDAAGNPIKVTSANSKDLQVGVLEGMPVRDEDTLGGNLVLTSQEAIDALEDGTQELSAGYGCDIVKVGSDYYQRSVRANHIAIVPKGRAGSSCRISDEAYEEETAKDEANEPLAEKLSEGDKYDEDELAMGISIELEHGGTKEEAAKIAKDHLDEVPDYYTKFKKCGIEDEATNTLLVDAQAELVVVKSKLIDAEAVVLLNKELLADLKDIADKASLSIEALKVELADAKVAASEGVVERCEAIEHARLIADMRDLGDKSVIEIKRLVVEDQYPDKDFSGKKDPYFDAMFEILVDSAKGETPMSKLMKSQESNLVVDAKPVDIVAEARKKMIKRQSGQHK